MISRQFLFLFFRMIGQSKRAKSLPIDELLIKLDNCINKRFSRLFKKRFFEKYYFFRFQQILDIMDLFFEINEIEIDKVLLQNIFEIQQTQLDRDLVQSHSPEGLHQKKKILCDEDEDRILRWISDEYMSYSPVSPNCIITYASELCQKTLSDGWYRYFIQRHSNELTKVKATQIDNARTLVTIDMINEYILTLMEGSQDIVSELFYNIDETANSAPANCHDYVAIIPKEYENMPCYYKVSRNEKNITAIVTITLSGDMIPPAVILPRTTIPSDFDYTGMRNGKDMYLMSSESGYINHNLFVHYLCDIVFPDITNKRLTLNMPEATALILMDNCSSHISEYVKSLCADNNIIIITYPPHSSHLLQPLDLVFFGLTKRNSRSKSYYSNFPEVVQRVATIINNIQKAGTSQNIRASFSRAGIFQDFNITPHIAHIDPTIIYNGIQGQIANDTTLINPRGMEGVKRKLTKFGFINSSHFDLAENGICPLCMSTLTSDDDDFNPEEETEEEEIFMEKN